MKVSSCTLLALSVFYTNLWAGAAFVTQPPSSPPSISQLSDTIGREKDVNVGNVPFQLPTGTQPTGGSLATPGERLSWAPDMQKRFDTTTLDPIIVQGGALRTWSYATPDVERVLVHLTTEGRFMESTIQLCQGPDNTPQAMKVTVGKGKLRPFKAVIETPGGNSAVFIRNRGPLEFPIAAAVGAQTISPSGRSGELMSIPKSIFDMKPGTERIVQGGAVHSRGLDAGIECCKVIIKTDGRPLNAKVELIQGPEANKYTIDIYSEDGLNRPFCTLLQTPGAGNVVRVVNTAPVEFPMFVSLEFCTSDEFGGSGKNDDAISKGPGPLWENGGNGFFNRVNRS